MSAEAQNGPSLKDFVLSLANLMGEGIGMVSLSYEGIGWGVSDRLLTLGSPTRLVAREVSARPIRGPTKNTLAVNVDLLRGEIRLQFGPSPGGGWHPLIREFLLSTAASKSCVGRDVVRFPNVVLA
jgi:hypothetical protein